MGAWIETQQWLSDYRRDLVAPHVGAWIETGTHVHTKRQITVAPHVGAWIETFTVFTLILRVKSRTPRGCVD